jgi:hypothetical protein
MKPTLDPQGSSPACLLHSCLNSLEKQFKVDYPTSSVADWYKASGLEIDNQRIPTILAKLKTVPLAGHTLKPNYRKYWWTHDTVQDLKTIWDGIDNNKLYIVGVKIWRDKNEKVILPGKIQWGSHGNGEYIEDDGEVTILTKDTPEHHIMALHKKHGDYIMGHLECENSWKRQLIASIKAKSFLHEVTDIWEIRFN